MKIHTSSDAPAASKKALDSLIKTFGWAPNVLGIFAGSPVLIQSYEALFEIINSNSSFTPAEREIIQIVNNIENDCDYCMAAHSTVAKMQNLFPDGQLEALRKSKPLADSKQQALHTFALEVLKQKGRITEAQATTFKTAGYTDEHILEIIVHSAFKVITNFTNNMAEPPLDEPFQAQQWKKEDSCK